MQNNFNQEYNDFSSLTVSNEDLEILNKPRYIISIFTYLAFLILPSLFVILFVLPYVLDNKSLIIQADSFENSIYTASLDTNSLLIIKPEAFDNTQDSYQDFFIEVYKKDNYSVYVHKLNPFILEKTFFDSNKKLTDDAFNKIMSGEITEWYNRSFISIYVPKDDVASFVPITLETLSITDGDIIITDLFNQIINFVSYLVFAALLIYILMPSIKLDIPQLKALSKKEIATHSGIGVLWILAFGIVFNIISFMLYRIFDIIPETSMNQMMINRALKSPGAIFIILTAVFVGPIVEELVFRKSFFGLIKNPKIALTVSSVCFGLIHMTTEIIQGDILMVVINGIGYISGGLALGYIYMKENKNIFIPIIAHMAYNLLSIVLSILG